MCIVQLTLLMFQISNLLKKDEGIKDIFNDDQLLEKVEYILDKERKKNPEKSISVISKRHFLLLGSFGICHPFRPEI